MIKDLPEGQTQHCQDGGQCGIGGYCDTCHQPAQASEPVGKVVASTGSLNDVAMIQWISDYRPKVGDLIFTTPQPAPQASERIAQITAHRACCGTEHDPANGKLHGYCVVCGVPWPCEYAGKPPKQTEIAP